MELKQYLDSTYLKTPEQSGLTNEQSLDKVKALTDEAIEHGIFAVMIRPDYISEIRKYIDNKNAKTVLGTVIGFHEGTYSTESKLSEAKNAIENGVDELDFVINYEAYKKGDLDLVKTEFVQCTALALDHKKVAKWIIEIAALTNQQIIDITSKIWEWAQENFQQKEYHNIFVKSSTGFFKTENGLPNGATFEAIKLMLDHAGDLPVKAAGGVRTHQDAVDMITLGVKRIGTSSALSLLKAEDTNSSY